jgi:hypothetical protein
MRTMEVTTMDLLPRHVPDQQPVTVPVLVDHRVWAAATAAVARLISSSSSAFFLWPLT